MLVPFLKFKYSVYKAMHVCGNNRGFPIPGTRNGIGPWEIWYKGHSEIFFSFKDNSLILSKCQNVLILKMKDQLSIQWSAIQAGTCIALGTTKVGIQDKKKKKKKICYNR